jgi:hypothetical protein
MQAGSRAPKDGTPLALGAQRFVAGYQMCTPAAPLRTATAKAGAASITCAQLSSTSSTYRSQKGDRARRGLSERILNPSTKANALGTSRGSASGARSINHTHAHSCWSIPRPSESNRGLADPARFAAMAIKRWHGNRAASALTASERPVILSMHPADCAPVRSLRRAEEIAVGVPRPRVGRRNCRRAPGH